MSGLNHWWHHPPVW